MPSALVGSIDTTQQVYSQFQLVDSATNQPIAGSAFATCQQDGSAMNVDSDGSSSQAIRLVLHPGDYDLTCKADGYADNQQVFHVVSGMSTLPDTISMTASGSAKTDVMLTGGVTGDSNAPSTSYAIKDESGTLVTSGSFDPTAGTALISGLTSGGKYTVERSATGYTTDTPSFTAPTSGSAATSAPSTASLLPMQKTGQDQKDLSATDPKAAAQTPATPDPVSNPAPPVPSYEWQYPNSEFGMYFTTTQARMYIGNVFIDEFHDVQFALQRNKVPVYGYCSSDPDAFGNGRALVQGQLSINFISEGYLFTVLQEYANNTPAETDSSVDDAAALLRQKADPSLTPDQLNAINSKLVGLAMTIGPDKLDQVRRAVTASSMTATSDITNALYSDIPFTLELQMTGAGRTVTRRLVNCMLISNEQVYDQSGDALRDVYGFVARQML